jgi:hypothetical protein
MKFRDVIGFSLQLVLPDRAMLAFERLSRRSQTESGFSDLSPADIGVNKLPSSVRLIEELDIAQFGGPSFGEQSIAIMTRALDEALAALPFPIDNSKKREFAQRILDRAADGERNLDRLREAAFGDFVASTQLTDYCPANQD